MAKMCWFEDGDRKAKKNNIGPLPTNKKLSGKRYEERSNPIYILSKQKLNQLIT